MKPIFLPSIEVLNSLFLYDKETGELTKRDGSKSGYYDNQGYFIVHINSQAYQGHRIIYKMVTGEEPPINVDHKDLNKSNNRWENIRGATVVLNSANTALKSSNTSGFKGVSFAKHAKKFVAHIRIEGKKTHLGYFATAKAAAEAYQEKAKELYGEFARF